MISEDFGPADPFHQVSKIEKNNLNNTQKDIVIEIFPITFQIFSGTFIKSFLKLLTFLWLIEIVHEEEGECCQHKHDQTNVHDDIFL